MNIVFIIISFIVIAIILLITLIILSIKLYFLTPKVQNKYENKLFNKLLKICKEINIPVSIKRSIEMEGAAGRFYYHMDYTGCYYVDKSKIYLHEDFKNSPWVLAHELGHYYAVKYFEDETEVTANIIGKQLVLNELNIVEKYILKIPINCYF